MRTGEGMVEGSWGGACGGRVSTARADDRSRCEHERGRQGSGPGRHPGDCGRAEGAADAVAGHVPALGSTLAGLRRPGDGGKPAGDTAGEHWPEEPRAEQQQRRDDRPGDGQQERGEAEEDAVDDRRDGDDSATVPGRVEAAGDERAEQVRRGDRSPQETGDPSGLSGGVSQQDDGDDRAAVGRAHQGRGEDVPGQRQAVTGCRDSCPGLRQGRGRSRR